MKQRKRKGKYLNRILACLGMMLILVNCFAGIVRADSYEQGKKGSFDLTIQEQNSEGTGSAPIAGVKLKLYKVYHLMEMCISLSTVNYHRQELILKN